MDVQMLWKQKCLLASKYCNAAAKNKSPEEAPFQWHYDEKTSSLVCHDSNTKLLPHQSFANLPPPSNIILQLAWKLYDRNIVADDHNMFILTFHT